MVSAVTVGYLLCFFEPTVSFGRIPKQNSRITQSTSNRRCRSASFCFPNSPSPYLAIITEPDACDTEQRCIQTYQAIQSAVSSNQVDLVSIRLTPSNEAKERAFRLIQQVVALSHEAQEQGRHGFPVVCSSDWVDVAIQAQAHGIHVKEHHQDQIPYIRKAFPYRPLIGTSAHSIPSVLSSYQKYQPDYYFVGTCYLTSSHPEKATSKDLEGPALPGQVRQAVISAFFLRSNPLSTSTIPPKILAIGGINETNCYEPVITYGADGVAVIKAVLAAKDPADAVVQIQSKISKSTMKKQN